jgi:CRISPR-associated endonuclease/helicase Cas3
VKSQPPAYPSRSASLCHRAKVFSNAVAKRPSIRSSALKPVVDDDDDLAVMEAKWAHTPNRQGEPHILVDHLEGTSRIARRFGESFDCGELAGQIGLVHDLGKADGCFQDYLRVCARDGTIAGRRRYPARDHKSAGARLLWQPTTAGLLGALAVYGHHGGLPAMADLRDHMQLIDGMEVETLAEAVLPRQWQPSSSGVADWATHINQRNVQDVEMLGRFLQSALADADFLDTAAHFGHPQSKPPPPVALLADRADEGHARLVAAAPAWNPVNRARLEAYEEAMSTTDGGPGWYQLPGMTGMGKTVVGLSWALRHARANGLRRVITAVPYITVTSQTADAYRDLLQVSRDSVVLEHHSRVVWPGVWAKLAAENWDASVVVTTTVRLFESLFARRPSDVRRLHRLARSVIVLDEAHTLPIRLLDALYDALRCLVERFGTSVLVMSATPPAVERVATVADCRPAPLLADPYRWPAFRDRVAWSYAGKCSIQRIASMIDAETQVLCVLNTARDAAQVARACREPVFYLARTLRFADVDERLSAIRAALNAGSPCRVVATQLVEAGVDLDFPAVIRALGPAPSLEQAAGRCNREGRLERGRAVVVDVDDGSPLPPDDAYSTGVLITRSLLADGMATLGDAALSQRWFERLLDDPAVLTDRHGVQEARGRFDYPEVERLVRLVDDEGLAIVVPWSPEDSRAVALDRVIDSVKAGGPLDPSDARLLQDVTVNVRPWIARRARELGMLPSDRDAFQYWSGPYDPLVGIDPDQLVDIRAKEVVW